MSLPIMEKMIIQWRDNKVLNGIKYLIKAGKYVIRSLICRIIWGRFTEELKIHTRDGLKFTLHFPEDKGWEYIYHHQSFETGTTNLIKSILKPDDIVFDIGANFGWYTILFSKIVTRGQCHAFEPVPWIYDKLRYHCSLNDVGNNVFTNQVAIGNISETVQLHIFNGICHGLSSISPLDKDVFSTIESQMITLNEYVKNRNIKVVNFIKCDVEGAEFDVVKGASALFLLEEPPMWLFEANEETSKALGYLPSDIFASLRDSYKYEFYRIKGAWRELIRMSSIYDYEHGDNVLCMIPHYHEARLSQAM